MAYTLISEQVLGSAASSVTFSSIPGTYTDLVLELLAVFGTADTPAIRVNGDTATNYSATSLEGNLTIAISQRQTSVSRFVAGGFQGRTTTGPGIIYVHLNSYANTSVYKTLMSRESELTTSLQATGAITGLWRSTAAITSITITTDLGNSYSSGTAARLWGIA